MTARGPVARSANWGEWLAHRPCAVPGARSGIEPGRLDYVATSCPQLDAIQALNQEHHGRTGDSEIPNRIAPVRAGRRRPERSSWSTCAARPGRPTRRTTERPGESASPPTACWARRLIKRGVRFGQRFFPPPGGDYPHRRRAGVEQNCRVVDQPIEGLRDPKRLRTPGRYPRRVGHGIRPDAGHPEHAARAAGGPRPSSPGLQRLAGRRSHPGRYRAIGATDELGWRVVEDPVHVHDFNATLLHLFGLDHLKLTHRFRGLDARRTKGQVNKLLMDADSSSANTPQPSRRCRQRPLRSQHFAAGRGADQTPLFVVRRLCLVPGTAIVYIELNESENC